MRYLALALFLLTFGDTYCAGSMEPIYSKADAVMDTTIVGNWLAVGDSGASDSMVIQRGDPRSAAYRVITNDEDGVAQHHEVHLTRINGLLYADIFTQHHPSFSISVHGILFARLERDRIVVHQINTDWLQKYTAAHPGEVRIDYIQGIAVFNDSTARIRSFLAKHGNAGLRAPDSSIFVRAPVPGTR